MKTILTLNEHLFCGYQVQIPFHLLFLLTLFRLSLDFYVFESSPTLLSNCFFPRLKAFHAKKFVFSFFPLIQILRTYSDHRINEVTYLKIS